MESSGHTESACYFGSAAAALILLPMVRGLAIETSGRLGSVALSEDGRVIAEDRFAHGLQHAAQIVPRIDALCRVAGWSPGQVEQVYVSTGPGSFTGLRIGITLAKTLSFATGARLVAVPSAMVLAHNAPSEAGRVLIVLDAKREQVFTALLERSSVDQWRFVEEPHLEALASAIARAPRPVHLIGEGIPFHRKFIPDEPGVIVTPEDTWTARASAVTAIGWTMAVAGQFTPADLLLPVYIRKPEAEEKWEAAAVAAAEAGSKEQEAS